MIPRFIPARGGERAHWALPTGQWVNAPQAGFYQPPRRPPSMGGYTQVRPNPNAGYTQVRPRPGNNNAGYRQIGGSRGPAGRSVADPARLALIHAIANAAMAGPDPVDIPGRVGPTGGPPPVNSVADIDAYIQWVAQQQAGLRGPKVY